MKGLQEILYKQGLVVNFELVMSSCNKAYSGAKSIEEFSCVLKFHSMLNFS